MTKYTYGEYRWNIRFQRGLKAIRDNKTINFEINTEDARHIFKKLGKYVERTTIYHENIIGSREKPRKAFYYYELKSGRRVCPIHLERLVGKDEWSRFERKCPVERCSYETEAYLFAGGVEINYTQKFEEIASSEFALKIEESQK